MLIVVLKIYLDRHIYPLNAYAFLLCLLHLSLCKLIIWEPFG